MFSLQYDSEFRTKLGQAIHVRAITPQDAGLLVDIFEHMSSDSRYKRFYQSLDSVDPDRVWLEATQIAEAVAGKSEGLLAFADLPEQADQPAAAVGAARFVETAPGEAEVAISLRDDFQNMGIGRGLMHLLAEDARDRGYKTLTASIRNDNPAIWRVFNSLPYQVIRAPEGSFSDITIHLDVARGK